MRSSRLERTASRPTILRSRLTMEGAKSMGECARIVALESPSQMMTGGGDERRKFIGKRLKTKKSGWRKNSSTEEKSYPVASSPPLLLRALDLRLARDGVHVGAHDA